MQEKVSFSWSFGHNDPNIWNLYGAMYKSRLFEELVAGLWHKGEITGEMHMGMGEEGICAGVISHLEDGDAMALDHRGTPPLIMRGVDPVLLLKELLGRSDGLCKGQGGHMHLFSKELLSASSGIVGASGPAAVGFALAAKYLRPEKVAVAFFGEGAMNQGMLMEAFNLAFVWCLPVVFVCKDNKWAITTESKAVTGGSVTQRAESFGLPVYEVDGIDVEEVWNVAGSAIHSARSGAGPSLIYAHCVHLEGHFLGDPLLDMSRKPMKKLKEMTGPLVKSIIRLKGGSVKERSASLKLIYDAVKKNTQDQVSHKKDPVQFLREKLKVDETRLTALENNIKSDINSCLEELNLEQGDSWGK
ncbi:MAG: thiamine pyrophosphate-dependent dehydrogenase E1 component subunit alpha [Thermodesulfobacteriota bacterium]|nr:thiamine pyrophosphate-dependent dehydrogenase E1 component subunit alpha [Thermodesulfobacteriota bacterium]